MKNKMIYLISILFLALLCSNSNDYVNPNPEKPIGDAEYVITLDKTSLSIGTGERHKLIPTLTKDGERVNFKDYTFTVTTSDNTIATLKEGADSIVYLIGMKEGEAELKIEAEKYKVDATCKVQVAKKVIKILAIGNSFSTDALEYNLWDIADADNVDIIVANMFIGGCSLATHVENAKNNTDSYLYIKVENGVRTERSKTDLAYALADEDWDYISMQEVSHQSGIYFYYETNLPHLAKYVRENCPNAKLMIHQTWAYAGDSGHSGFANYNRDQNLMYSSIVNATKQAAELANIDIIIPAGTAIQNARTSGLGDTFCRDGYHLELGVGRYTAACTWYEKVLNRSVLNNKYTPHLLSDWRKEIAQHAAHSAVLTPYAVTRLIDYMGEEPEMQDKENNAILEQPILIDFGGKGADMSPAPWINITEPSVCPRLELTDANGSRTGILFRITKEFGSVNMAGATTTPSEWGLPTTASKDSFWGNDEVPFMNKTTKESEITISSLNKNLKYVFQFFGSRVGSTDNRETLYIVKGATTETVSLNTASNLDKIATTSAIAPDKNGTVTITVTHGPQNNNLNKFYYLNAMTISQEK